MFKSTVSWIMLTLLLALSLLTFAFNIRPVKSEPNAIIVPDDYPTIQEAINNANEGDTIYVKSGTYYEHVVVNKSVSLVGENRSNTIIDGNGTENVVDINASNVNISGFKIQSGTHGLYLYNCNNTVISNLKVSNNGGSIYLYNCWFIDIKKNWIENTVGHSIFLSDSFSNLIYNNEISRRGGYGIYLFFSSNNTVKGNVISEGYEYAGNGIELEHSHQNAITNNIMLNNGGCGISLESSNGNIIYHNNFINNRIQVYRVSSNNTWEINYEGNYWSDYNGTDVDGDGVGDTEIPHLEVDYYPLIHQYGSIRNLDTNLTYLTIQSAINAPETSNGHTIHVRSGVYYEHVVINKTLSLIGKDRNSTIIDGNGTETTVRIKADYVNISRFTIRNGYCVPHIAYGIEVHGCNNVVISDTVVSQNDIGIFLYYSKGNIVENSLIFNNWRGICMTLSDQNQLMNNSLFANQEVGITIGSNADDNIIYDNKIYDNGLCGIIIGWSGYNKIVGNMLSCNNEAGIRLDASNNNNIIGNHIASNHRDGIVLFGSNSNTVTGNTLIQNEWDGIALWYSNSNSIYHNNFLDNTKQAGSYSGSINTWNYGYPSGGNYWSNYAGSDENSGPNQDQHGSDGLGDTPYVIHIDNRDRYPLMNPWSPLPAHNINTGLGYAVIQEAINASETLDGHTIFIEAGTYYENVVVSKNVALFGENKNTTVIVGVAYSPVWEPVISVRADDVKIANLTVTNGGKGITLFRGKRNTVTDCVAYGNGFGLAISGSSQNFLRRNILFNNSHNLLVLGSWSIDDFLQDIDSSNLVDGKPVYYLINEENLSINPVTFPNVGYLAVVNSSNVQISNLSLSRNGNGLLIAFSPNTLIENVEATHNHYGISLMCSPRTTVKHCNFSYNHLGIFSYYSDRVNIKENNISHNEGGIFLMCSNYGAVYHNNFIENYRYHQARVDKSHNVHWDDGYPSGGNYWSDYAGVDVKSGPNQDQPSSDGIGDTAYVIDADNQDNYPLMEPWGVVSGNLQILKPANGAVIVGPVNITFTIENTGRNIEFAKGDSANRIDLEIEYALNQTHGWGIKFWSTSDHGLNLSSGEKYRQTIVYDPSEYEEAVPPDFIEDAPYGEVTIRLVHWKQIEGSYSYGEFGMTEITVTLQRNDTAPPTMTLLSPENKTYTTTSIPLTFTPNETTSWIGYSLDNQANVTITGNTTLTGLSEGTHSITVYANDTSGNMGASEIVYFTVSLPYGPTAEFAVTPETADVGESVKFDASASLLGWNGTHGLPITEYHWDFADGNKTTTSTPILYYSFISPGIYYVTLTVYAPGATPEMDSTTHKVTVISAPVGGYSVPIKGYTTKKPLTLYLALIGILTASFTIAKRRKKQQS